VTITQPTYPITTSALVTYLGAYSDSMVGFNVKSYGAVGDYDPVGNTGTNDTAAFTAAVTAAAGASVYGGVGAVFVPKGNYSVAASALNAIPNRVAIIGSGMGSTIYRRTGTNGAFIRSAALARCIMIANIRIDGNSARVTDTTADGIILDAPEPQSTAEFLDGRHMVSNVMILNTGRTALTQLNRGVCLVDNVQIWSPGGHGLDVSIDSRYSNVDVGRAGWDGFMIRGGGNTFVGCKAWFSGAVSTTGNSETNGTGHGFHFQAANYSANDLAGCSAQDNGRSGFYLNNVGRQQLVGCDADSNNSLNTSACGVEIINAYGNTFIGNSWDRAANAQPQIAALRISGGSANVVEMTYDGTMPQGRLSTDSDATFSQVRFGPVDGLNWATFATPFTPDAGLAGETIRLDLTGNITISAPTKPHAGQRLTFIFRQDATGGRTVTWNAIFKQNWSPTTTASKVNTITFVYDGANWVQVATGLNL
jgi:hypothetical protein